MARWETAMKPTSRQLAELYNQLEASVTGEQAQRLLEMDEARVTYLAARDHMLELSRSGLAAKIERYNIFSLLPAFEHYTHVLGTMVSAAEATSIASTETMSQDIMLGSTLLYVACGLGIVLALLV